MFARFTVCAVALSAACAGAQADGKALEGIMFSRHDWELTCDNTGFCRAAGYQAEEDFEHPVSVSFSRKAGKQAPVQGEILFYAFDRQGEAGSFNEASLRINGRQTGRVKLADNGQGGKLSAGQTQTLLQALKHKSRIELRAGRQRWQVSDAGAAAVLLKMDEFQQRVNTPSALIRKGKSRHAVLQPRAKPAIRIPAVAKAEPREIKAESTEFKKLEALLRQYPDPEKDMVEFCNRYQETGITVHLLDKRHTLLQVPCVAGAYQSSDAYFVMNAQMSKVIQKVGGGHGGNDEGYKAGRISSAFKGRGLGDCWGFSTWAWNGRKFVLAEDSHTGMCKGFPGGAWRFSRFTLEIREVE